MTDHDFFLDCVHCGLCLSFCPTYDELGTEMDSPRGRIYLMRAVAEGRLTWEGRATDHLGLCLGCLACETACPSGVHYRHLLEQARADIRRTAPQSLADRFLHSVIFARLFPYPRRLGRALAAYQRTGLQCLVRRWGLHRWLPARWRAMETVLPSQRPKGKPLPAVIPPYESSPSLTKGGPGGVARDQPVARVGLLIGCVQSVLFADVNAATARVLAASGCEVVVPPQQVCCGALASHNGDWDAARRFARRNIDAFGAHDSSSNTSPTGRGKGREGEGRGGQGTERDRGEPGITDHGSRITDHPLDAIIVNAAGCGAAMKDYGTLLQDAPDYAEKAAAFSARVRDVTEFLAALWQERPPVLRPLSARVTYHDACHLAHGQRITAEPRQLLRLIPGLDLVELPEADWCCGSAGVYSIAQPEMSQRLLHRKVKHLLSTGADLVIACNPGCLLQIRQGLEQTGSRMEPLHLVELLERAMEKGREEERRGRKGKEGEGRGRAFGA